MSRGSVHPDDCYVRDEHVVTRLIADETIIVPMKQTVEDLKAIFTLNEMAGVIWERIDGRHQRHRTDQLDIPRVSCGAGEA